MKFGKFLLITTITLASLLVGCYPYARYIEPNLLMVNRENLVSSKLKAPLKIVFFGDTHLGEFNDNDQLRQIVEKINAQNADLVVFTGDLIGSVAISSSIRIQSPRVWLESTPPMARLPLSEIMSMPYRINTIIPT